MLALGNKIPKPKWRPLGNSKAEFRFRSRTSPSGGLQRVWFKRFLSQCASYDVKQAHQPNVQSDFHFQSLKRKERSGKKGGASEVSSFKLQNENAGRAPGETSRKSKFQPWGREKGNEFHVSKPRIAENRPEGLDFGQKDEAEGRKQKAFGKFGITSQVDTVKRM